MVKIDWFKRIPTKVLDRLVGAFLFFPSAAVLATALSLAPSPDGVGTHRQLGLGGCAVLVIAGIPCPMCGMTTTFSHLAHGHLIAGTLNQPFGLLLFAATVYAFAIGFLDLVVPRARWRRSLRWVENRETAVALTLLVGMVVGWLYKIILMRGFFPWSP